MALAALCRARVQEMHGITLEMKWPEHPVFPDYGYVVRRRDLDQMVADHAAGAGATVHQATEAVRPLLRDGLLTGALVKDKVTGETREIRARYVIVADGSLSRFGRALGAARDKSYPQGIAIRGYFESPISADPWIESCLDVRDRSGAAMPGYGWIFPLGDGTINVGIGLLSTFKGYKDVNTSHLMTEWAATAPERWGIDPDAMLAPATGGRLPMAGSINPKVGPNWLLVGDAAGSINPFNGEGIDYAYETARMAAGLLDEALVTGSAGTLSVPSAAVNGVAIVAVLITVVLLVVPPARNWLWEKLGPTLRQVWPRVLWVVGSPRRLVMGIGGNVVMTVGYVGAFGAALAAFGFSLPVTTLAITYLTSNTVGAAIPSPGGIGPVEAALTGGLTFAGIPAGVAFSAALVFRVLTFWARVPFGWVALRYLQRKGDV